MKGHALHRERVHLKVPGCSLRVPNRFSVILDLAYLNGPGFGIWGKGGARREWDTGFGNLTKRDSGNSALQNRDLGSPVTK